MFFFWLFAVVSAQNEKIPDPPKIDLDISTLKLYGFKPQEIIEVNRPGQLDRLLSKKLDSNVTDINQLPNQGYDIGKLAQGFTNSSTYTLEFFRKRPEKDIVTFFNAHLINAMYLVFQRMVDFDDAAVQTVMNMTEYDSTKRIADYCKKNIIVQAIAAQNVGGTGDSSCTALAQQTINNPVLLQSYLTDALANKIAVIQAVRQLEAGLVNIVAVIAPTPLPTASLLRKPQVEAMKDVLKDYYDWVKKTEKNKKFNEYEIFGSTMDKYREEVMKKANAFFAFYP